MEIVFLKSLVNRIGIESMGGVEAEVTDHNEMWILNMLCKTKYEVNG